MREFNQRRLRCHRVERAVRVRVLVVLVLVLPAFQPTWQTNL